MTARSPDQEWTFLVFLHPARVQKRTERKRFFLKKKQKLSSVAVAAGGRAALCADDVMVDPLGDEPARLIHRGFGMMNPVEGRAGTEGLQVPIAMYSEFAIRGNDSALATASDSAERAPHSAKAPACQNRASPPAIRVATTVTAPLAPCVAPFKAAGKTGWLQSFAAPWPIR
jgi:hypothetical protein